MSQLDNFIGAVVWRSRTTTKKKFQSGSGFDFVEDEHYVISGKKKKTGREEFILKRKFIKEGEKFRGGSYQIVQEIYKFAEKKERRICKEIYFFGNFLVIFFQEKVVFLICF